MSGTGPATAPGTAQHDATPNGTVRLVHNRIELALHELRAGTGRHLLLLHGLGERSPERVPAWAAGWPGPIAALDFTGHGESSIPVGGGYTTEILLGDADTALAHLGTATVVGRGLGAFVALQLAGARPDRVVGTVLSDGPGLAGGPAEPTSQSVVSIPPATATPDPYALVELGRDLRPPDYATTFARLAVQGSHLDEPITVAATYRPAWLAAVAAELGVAARPIEAALAHYAGAPSPEPR
jgi:pimeloyl-ACP methyl ester carboxylesterase